MTTRRALLSAIPALICAPAIVRVSSLMPVRSFAEYEFDINNGASVMRYIVRVALRGTIVDNDKFDDAMMRWEHPDGSNIFLQRD